ncbi:MAG: hypothetical protein Q8Q09_13250 [Deltaproteobacteria bacterium]|nr:hypothetical protein [Deltaproteobacteria bacterium]
MSARSPWIAGLVLTLCANTLYAQSQDDSGFFLDATAPQEVSDAAVVAVGSADASAPATSPGTDGLCESDELPNGHVVRIETRVTPTRPSLGDRVIITYRLYAASSDRVEFEPDPAAFAQPSNELEYARTQPDRDRRARSGPAGLVYGEVSVAVQAFKSGEIVIGPQLARLTAATDVLRVCTPTVRFRVGDPFGNTPHPQPKDLTPPEPVSALSTRWRTVMLGIDGAFVVALATLGVSALMRSRPKVVPPPPPPTPPWILAIEGLDVLGKSDLLSRGNIKEYYQQLSDIVRRYIGALRGFDALEMTTHEVLSRIKRVPVAGVTTTEVEHLLRECDLVKFARYIPGHEDSEQVLEQAYLIVRRSSPMGQRALADEELEAAKKRKRESAHGEEKTSEKSSEESTVEHPEKRA